MYIMNLNTENETIYCFFFSFFCIILLLLSFKGTISAKDTSKSGEDKTPYKLNNNSLQQNNDGLSQNKCLCDKIKELEGDDTNMEWIMVKTFGRRIGRFCKIKKLISRAGYFTAFFISLGFIIT